MNNNGKHWLTLIATIHRIFGLWTKRWMLVCLNWKYDRVATTSHQDYCCFLSFMIYFLTVVSKCDFGDTKLICMYQAVTRLASAFSKQQPTFIQPSPLG